MGSYILTHGLCEACVFGENGYYNPTCAHCPYCTYSKRAEPSFMSRETAEMVGAVKKKAEVTKDE